MKIKEKTVDWVCKIMREDADKNKKKDNPDFGYLPCLLKGEHIIIYPDIFSFIIKRKTSQCQSSQTNH